MQLTNDEIKEVLSGTVPVKDLADKHKVSLMTIYLLRTKARKEGLVVGKYPKSTTRTQLQEIKADQNAS